jgi:hypothetical protein
MRLFRMTVIAAAGLAFVALLGKVTSAPYALFCYGTLMAGYSASELVEAANRRSLDVPVILVLKPIWKLPFTLIYFLGFLAPPLVGLIWFRWWWGLAAYGLAGVGVAFSMPIFPWHLLRISGGMFMMIGVVVWWLA